MVQVPGSEGGSPVTIEELCKRSHDTAVAKGWHKEPRSLGEVIALFHSEVSEALECWRDPNRKLDEIWHADGKPEGFVIELVDLLIRIGDTVIGMELPVVKYLRESRIVELGSVLGEGGNGVNKSSIPDWLSMIHRHLSQAFSMGSGRPDSVAFFLAKAMEEVGSLCRHHGLDLEKALLLKMDYNDLRSYRHGGKRA